MIENIEELLYANPYPGRGILIGRSEDGKRGIIVYFIMGRSENSRNRIFERTFGGIRTTARDETKVTNPELIIYHPVRTVDEQVIVTNGDQTDTIANHLKEGYSFLEALHTREFEPDAPNYTPRISALVQPSGSYVLSILKTLAGNPNHCQRSFFDYSSAIPGLGHFISTYETDGNPLPSFEGEPIPVQINDTGGLEQFALNIWNALNSNNKVSLYARETNYITGEINDLIVNKHA
ncbi:MAG: IMP cyclohydrolase [Oscillospiraceae bacterium]|nr:IMP cyclohydrolase [Oscillospiraceae bacterium]MCL2278665.1 IMP cyclohydrolase [Oscillospiraceae bacterium]